MSFEELDYSWEDTLIHLGDFDASFAEDDSPSNFFLGHDLHDFAVPSKDQSYLSEPVVVCQPPTTSSHSRNSSCGSTGSCFSQNTMADLSQLHVRTPAKSPAHQLGPLLLPKIRSQDQVVEAPRRAARKSSPCRPVSRQQALKRPGHVRAFSTPVRTVQAMPPSPPQSRASSVTCSPESVIQQHQRRMSTHDLDSHALAMYSYPTYRQAPAYYEASNLGYNQPFFPPASREPSPLGHELSFEEPLSEFQPFVEGPTTTLLAYLTTPNPSPAVVDRINYVRDLNAKHFWWDVRQIRPWTSFAGASMLAMPDMHSLLTVPVSASTLPEVAHAGTTFPESEAALQATLSKFYTAKLNTALRQAQGPHHLQVRAGSTKDEPAFISNYVDDTSSTLFGHAHVVGLVKSWESWNVGMRTDQNHKRVEYLRGLAELHGHMRDRHCRYGFILTETDLTVVRNGTEKTPHFGYLEVQTISLSDHDDGNGSSDSTTLAIPALGASAPASFTDPLDLEYAPSSTAASHPTPTPIRMTGCTALFYLHMLAREIPLPGQARYRAEIGAAAQGSRQNALPKDQWMPAPQLAEKRAAKRARGWVWPEEPVGRKELGKRGVNYGGDYRRRGVGR